jgi:purine-cytosine permease-like protein
MFSSRLRDLRDKHLSLTVMQAFGRYAMGWWPSKIVVILNLIQMLGYCLIDCVVGGQILSAVSPNGNLSVAVGE